MDTPLTVRDKLLAHAITLMMLRGYNGFSYRDLSALVGVKTSSIHYYFPSKDDLALEAVSQYSSQVMTALQGVDAGLSADAKLTLYARMFAQVLGDGHQICLCGMLAADIESLPEAVRQAVQAFFRANERWLAQVLAEGIKDGTLTVNGDPEHAAQTLFAAFQGSALTSRLFHSPARLEDVCALWRTKTPG